MLVPGGGASAPVSCDSLRLPVLRQRFALWSQFFGGSGKSCRFAVYSSLSVLWRQEGCLLTLYMQHLVSRVLSASWFGFCYCLSWLERRLSVSQCHQKISSFYWFCFLGFEWIILSLYIWQYLFLSVGFILPLLFWFFKLVYSYSIISQFYLDPWFW